MAEKDWWDDYPWRLIQTNLREIDMADIDAGRVVADLKHFRATVLMINAAGIIASYPTKLPFHYQSPYLTGDSLADILAACHDAGIRVIARTDFSKVRRPVFDRHPEWAYRTAGGEIVDYNGNVHVCINGQYQQRRALEILEELLTTHEFDGVFFNMGGYVTRDYSGRAYGPCHCDACRRRFAQMYNLPLPGREDLSDPVWRKYKVFQRVTRGEHEKKVGDFLRKLRPGLCVANHLHSGRGFIRQESNTAMDRPLPRWLYSASDNTRWARASHPHMVASNTTVDFIDFPYRHAAVSPHQQRLRLAQALANGGSLDYYLIGRLDNHEDRSGFEAVREMFAHHAANEDSYRDLASEARIALLKGGGAEEYRGWFRFLLEHHFLFDVLTVEAAGRCDWSRYDGVILPDVESLSDGLAGRLDEFVSGGGALVASGRTGFRDADLEPRDLPALACLGVRRVGHVRAETRGSYFRVEDKAGFGRLAETELVYLDGPYVYADYAEAAQRRFRLVPPHRFGPPEMCYYRAVTDHPAFVVHPFGDGRAVYVPWRPGALFYRQGHTNTSRFAADLLEHVAGLPRLGGNLPPQVEATLHQGRAGGFRLLHLVNASGHFGNSFYAPAPLIGLEVTVPADRAPGKTWSLTDGERRKHDWQDGQLTVRIPRLELLEAVRIE